MRLHVCSQPHGGRWVFEITGLGNAEPLNESLQVDVFDGLCQTLARAGFPGVSAGKESSCNAGDLSSIPGLGRSPGEGEGYPL